MRQRRQQRLIVLALGVVIFHTLVTVLEEKLFNEPAFTSNAGGAFMTSVKMRVIVYSCSARSVQGWPAAWMRMARCVRE